MLFPLVCHALTYSITQTGLTVESGITSRPEGLPLYHIQVAFRPEHCLLSLIIHYELRLTTKRSTNMFHVYRGWPYLHRSTDPPLVRDTEETNHYNTSSVTCPAKHQSRPSAPRTADQGPGGGRVFSCPVHDDCNHQPR